eukprot:5438371-Prymnesium_polylepis.1
MVTWGTLVRRVSRDPMERPSVDVCVACMFCESVCDRTCVSCTALRLDLYSCSCTCTISRPCDFSGYHFHRDVSKHFDAWMDMEPEQVGAARGWAWLGPHAAGESKKYRDSGSLHF